jgi:hypothetical protein
MRFAYYVTAALALFLATPSPAQTWTQYPNIEDRFLISFPGPVQVENIMYMTEDDMMLRARRHVAEWNGGIYAVTSVDFTPLYEAYHTTLQGSMAHAATNFRKRGTVTYDAYARTDRIPSHNLQITEPGGRRLYVTIVLHQDEALMARRLIIAEASVPPNSRPPSLFLAGLGVLDAMGNRIRYEADGVTRAR